MYAAQPMYIWQRLSMLVASSMRELTCPSTDNGWWRLRALERIWPLRRCSILVTCICACRRGIWYVFSVPCIWRVTYPTCPGWWCTWDKLWHYQTVIFTLLMHNLLIQWILFICRGYILIPAMKTCIPKLLYLLLSLFTSELSVISSASSEIISHHT